MTTVDAPVVDQFVISTYTSKDDNVPKRNVIGWPALAERLCHHDVLEQKATRLWSPARYDVGAKRLSNNVVEVTLAAFDLDDGTNVETIAYWLADLEYVISSTFSHTPEHPKLRVVICLAEPIPRDEFDDAWRRMNQHLLHGHVDPSTKDAARMFYVPSYPPGGPEPVAIHHPGRSLDWRALPALPKPRPISQGPGNPPFRTGTDDLLRRRAQVMLEKWRRELASMAPSSGRHNRLLGLARSAGGLIAYGLLDRRDVDDALYGACEANGLVEEDGAAGVERTLADGRTLGETQPWNPDDIPDSWVKSYSSRRLAGTPLSSLSSLSSQEVPDNADGLSSLISLSSQEPAWPEALDHEAMYGLAGDFVGGVAPYSEACEAALLAHFLAAAAALIGPSVHAEAGDAVHPARLNAVLVGESSKGRKGSSWQPTRRLLDMVQPGFTAGCTVEGLSSGEGLIWQVRDRITKTEMVGKGADRHLEEIEVDPGVTDKRLLAIESELATTLRVMAREGNSLSAVIRRAWDSGDTLRTLTKNTPAKATGAHICIVGHVTREEFLRYLDRTELANGFANRFLVFASDRGHVLPDGESTPSGVLLPVAERLRDVVEWARHPRQLRRDQDASAVWHDVYAELSAGRPGLLGCVTNRAEAQVLRLSVLYAALDCAEWIRAEHLMAALAVWKYADASARWVFGNATGNPDADAVLAEIRSEGGEMKREALVKALSGHVYGRRLDRALVILEAAGLLHKLKTQSTGGRPPEVWRVV